MFLCLSLRGSVADGLAYSALLKNELLGAGIEKVQDPQSEDQRLRPSTPERRRLFNVSASAVADLKSSLPCVTSEWSCLENSLKSFAFHQQL